MLNFSSDYLEGAHPLILKKLIETNFEKTAAYGGDVYSLSAAEKIRKACGCPDAEVRFLTGGTQTNATVIASALRPYECVISANTGHINVHEAGAIEATGHKIITLPHKNGKLHATDIEKYMIAFNGDSSHNHMTLPRMVYISHPTEYGTLYTRDELAAISSVCKNHDMLLFLDGARLGYGLAADNTDVDLALIASLCDVFYIGGTKVGAMFGEAVVIPNKDTLPHFFTMIKQCGALLAKGRMTGIQFDVLFTDDLYTKIARHAIIVAYKLRDALRARGYEFYFESPTNQQFIVLPDDEYARLSHEIGFSFWEKLEGRTVVRLATSWATKEEDIDKLISLL